MPVRLPPFDIGFRIGDWTVTEQLEKDFRGKKNVAISRVRCVCGTEKELANSYLRIGTSNGCGCRRGRALGLSGITHGKTGTPIHNLWCSIKYRLQHYDTYAGISMYAPWKTNFEAFEAFILNLGPKPSPSHTLDRIDPRGDYAPGNLRWADKTEQALNRTNNVVSNLKNNSTVSVGKKYDMLTVLELVVKKGNGRNWYGAKVRCDCGTIKTVKQYQLLSEKTKSCGCLKNRNLLLGGKSQEVLVTAYGETRNLKDWAKHTGISPQVINRRLHVMGWTPERAVSEGRQSVSMITIDGVTRSTSEWAKINGVSPGAAHNRIHKLGWNPIRAVTEPTRVPGTATVDGVTRTIAEWCRVNNLDYAVVYHRIRRDGWDPARAVTEPSRVVAKAKSDK